MRGYDQWKTTPPEAHYDPPDEPEHPWSPPNPRRERIRRAVREAAIARSKCPFHCGEALASRARSIGWRRMAQSAYEGRTVGNDNGDIRAWWRRIAWSAWDTWRALREQVPHNYLGGLSSGYEPPHPDAPNRRMVVRLG